MSYFKVNASGKILIISDDILNKIPYFKNLYEYAEKNEIPYVDMNPIILEHIFNKINDGGLIDNKYQQYLDYLCIDDRNVKKCDNNVDNNVMEFNDNQGCITQLVAVGHANIIMTPDNGVSHYLTPQAVYHHSASNYMTYNFDNNDQILLQNYSDTINMMYIIIHDDRNNITISEYIDSIHINDYFSCSGKYLEHFNGDNTKYVKIPFIFGKESFMRSCDRMKITVKFNLNVKKELLCHVSFIDKGIEKLYKNPKELLIHNPIDQYIGSENNIITCDISTKYNVRDFYFEVKNLSHAILYYDDHHVRFSYDAHMLNKIIPKYVLKKELPKNCYYFSFAEDGDMVNLRGYGKIANVKSCKLELHLKSEQKAWICYNQVYKVFFNEGSYCTNQV